MLLHKDLKGDGDLQENTALKAMLEVGNEFMTERRDGSEVQRSGQFVSMKKEQGGTLLRWLALWETPDGLQLDTRGYVEWLDDSHVPLPYDDDAFLTRTRLLLGEVEQADFAPLPFRGQTPREPSRQPRFTALVGRVVDVDNQAKQAKQRVFSMGDGSVLLVQELTDPADTRWLGGVDSAGLGLRNPNRVARVQLWRLQYDSEASRFKRELVLECVVRSGLGFDPSGLTEQYSAPGSATHDGQDLWLGNAGLMWGRLFDYSSATADQSGYYAVAQPALAMDGGKSYMSQLVVHGLNEDAYNAQTSALWRLTCTYTTPDGVRSSKIVMPTREGSGGQQYLSPFGMRLYRMGPRKLMLRVWLTPQRLSGVMYDYEAGQIGEACWITEDGGAAWALIPQTTADVVAWGTGGSWVVRDSDSCIKVLAPATASTTALSSTTSCRVFEADAAGARQIGEIPMSLFNVGLHAGFVSGSQRVYPDYEPVGEGGTVLIDGVRHLWLQFDPVLRLREGYEGSLVYPASRPMVLLSADGGATWARRMLPSPWPHQVGFVQSLDESTLGVPVFEPRLTEDGLGQVPVRLHVSKDAAQQWRPSKEKFKLPAYAWIDGQMGAQWEGAASNTVANAFNRGELSYLVQLRNAKGDLSPICPDRPWIADAQVEVPYGQ